MLEELYEEDVDDALPLGLLAAAGLVQDDPNDFAEATERVMQELEGVALHQVRAMVVRLRQLEREAEQVAQTKRAVVASYDEKCAGLQGAAAELRGALTALLMRGPYGPRLTFPDAGTIGLTTKGGNLHLASKEEAVSTYGFRFERPVVDEAALNAWARDYYKATGQVPLGYEVVPKRKTLVVKEP